MASEPDYVSNPLTFPHVGWRGSVQPSDTKPVLLGAIYVPSHFELGVYSMVEGAEVQTTLQFTASREQGAVLRGIRSSELEDAATALRRLTREHSINWWTREAVDALISDERLKEAADKYDPEYKLSPPDFAAAMANDADIETLWQSERAYIKTMPLTKRRNRVTPDFLLEVAQTYREAWEAGQPPTKAVEAKFKTSPSTAARWVGMARKIKGGLGPADGTKGGVSNDEA